MVNKVEIISAKPINQATGIDAVWLYFAIVISAPEHIGSLASLMLAKPLLLNPIQKYSFTSFYLWIQGVNWPLMAQGC